MINIHKEIKNVIHANAIFLTQSEDLAHYLQGTEGLNHFPDKKRVIIGAVKAHNKADIKALLDLANLLSNNEQLRFSIHPISSGKNWGYGTSQPPTPNNQTLILDLSTLNQIHFDEELGLATLEPGVTQKQLSAFLIERGDNFMVPVTGAGPDCSIVGNALERGYGITPHSDHFSAVNALKGYWANGRAFQSAIYELDQSKEKLVDKTFKWGVGPHLDALFTQSSFGIVTEMTIRLACRSPAFSSFFIQLTEDDILDRAVPIIRRVLRYYEGIVGSINLMDKRRVLAMFANNPNGRNLHKVMSEDDVTSLALKYKVPCWTIVGSIYGSKGVVKAAQKEICTIFKALPSKQVFSNSFLVKSGKFVIDNLPEFFFKLISVLEMMRQQLKSFDLGNEIMLGKPNKIALKLPYWRHKDNNILEHSDLSPGKDNCGLLWYAPLIPMKANAMKEFSNLVRDICPKYNIEPFITFTNLKHDCVDSTIPIVFDQENHQAVQDAHNCLKELVAEGLKKGFVPYRLNIDQQQYLLDKNSDFWQTSNQLKALLDPNQVLSSGRYNPL
jgi:4-cresol dehydrogenase (hydroxylating)